jgi:DNA-binding MarR family transcriptional regulator
MSLSPGSDERGCVAGLPGEIGRLPAAPSGAPVSAAFVLAQLGAFATEKFAERMVAVGLTPPQAGILRAIALTPGQSQQMLAHHLRTQPSRVVVWIDELEGQGLVERRRNLQDRRARALYLTPAGQAVLQQIGRIATEHDAELLAPLNDAERRQLSVLLGRLQGYHALTPGVHPGYRRLDGLDTSCQPPH